ncbi:hypothetical protein K474DRAFT_1713568 [Panus rudis PR-1116 ss-1]|nr:hypothetical protein K474DRAFT_1713568 [Panus rudis PR-1116 ss-1]
MSLFPLPTPEYTLGGGVLLAATSFIPYGITMVQAYSYMLNYTRDPLWMKILVALVTILETVFSALVLHVVYYLCIDAWGDFISVNTIFWSAPGCVVAMNLVVTIVQGYYVYRLWILSSRNKLLTALVGVIYTARIGEKSALSLSARPRHLILIPSPSSSAMGDHSERWTVESGCIVSAVTDGLIAATLTFYIRRSRSRLRRTDNVVRWIIVYAVNTGAISMMVSICIAVTFIALKKSVTFAGLVLLVGRSYANSFLGTLNARTMLKSNLGRSAYAEVEEYDIHPHPKQSHRPAVFKLRDFTFGSRRTGSSSSVPKVTGSVQDDYLRQASTEVIQIPPCNEALRFR